MHALDDEGVVFGEGLRGIVEAGLDGGPVEVGGFLLFGELLADRAFDGLHVDGEQLRGDANVDHVLDELAQLGFGTNRRGELVEGHRVTGHVVAILFEVGGFFVDRDGAGMERQDVFARGLGVHRDEDVDVFFAGDVAVFAGADGEPGGQAGDVGGEKILAADGHAHGEDTAEEDAVGRLGAGAVDGSYLDAEVVDDRLLRSRWFHACFALRRRGAGVGGRHVAVFPSDRNWKENCSLFPQASLYRDGWRG